MGKYFGTDGFRGEANVVLTVEHGVLLDVAVSGEACEHDRLDGGLVRHGKGAGQA